MLLLIIFLNHINFQMFMGIRVIMDSEMDVLHQLTVDITSALKRKFSTKATVTGCVLGITTGLYEK